MTDIFVIWIAVTIMLSIGIIGLTPGSIKHRVFWFAMFETLITLECAVSLGILYQLTQTFGR